MILLSLLCFVAAYAIINFALTSPRFINESFLGEYCLAGIFIITGIAIIIKVICDA